MKPLFPELIEVSEIEPINLFDFKQKVLFSPQKRGEGFIKFALTTGKFGAKSIAHSHPRDEVAYTIYGEAILRANGKEYHMRKGVALRIPPGLIHETEVISDEWQVITAYCDECSVFFCAHFEKVGI